MAHPANRGTPYAVCVRYRWQGEPTRTTPQAYRKRLSTALELVRRTETKWLRLVGGQPTPLTWLVVDVRDFTEYRPGIAYRFGETDGTDESGRPYARRAGGGRLGGDPEDDAGRGQRGGGSPTGA